MLRLLVVAVLAIISVPSLCSSSKLNPRINKFPITSTKPLLEKAAIDPHDGSSFVVQDSWWTTHYYNNMPIDHFSYSFDNDTFNMRYLINDTNWKPGGPIFFYCGNEGDITLFAKNTGMMWEIAPSFGAMVVFAEHRYYGKTQPYGKQSYANPKNLGKLTSEQALADYAVFLTWLKKTKSGAAKSPVIAFGGSYGGMLAAWIRVKYPHIVYGSLASSAPILYFNGYTPCASFADIVTSTFHQSGQNCDANIRKSWAVIRHMAQTVQGRTFLNKQFNLCSNSQMVSAGNATAMVNWLNSAWSYLAMIDYPYPTNFLAPVPGWPVKVACSKLSQSNPNNQQLMKGIFDAVTVYLNYTGQEKCFTFGNQGTPALGTNGWDFQACTEMVMPMCQTNKSMFEYQSWDLPSYSAGCHSEFGIKPRINWATTNYGGNKLQAASNIIFSNGLLDPWSGGSPLQNPNPKGTVVLNITLGAHHLDLRGSNSEDPQEIKTVRLQEQKLFKSWLSSYYADHRMKSQWTRMQNLKLYQPSSPKGGSKIVLAP